MSRLVDAYFNLLKFVIVACLALMVVLVFSNVVLRYGFGESITLSEELSRWLFVWLTFLAAVVAMREHAHLGMDTLVKRLPEVGQKACAIAAHVLMLLATGLILKGSWHLTQINLGSTAPASGLSIAWLYGIGLVFAVSAGAILLADLWRILTGRITGDALVMVRESEEQEEVEALSRKHRP